jgi:hypothetical protein
MAAMKSFEKEISKKGREKHSVAIIQIQRPRGYQTRGTILDVVQLERVEQAHSTIYYVEHT